MMFSKKLVLFILLGLIIGLGSNHIYAEALIGKQSPDFVLTDTDGKKVQMSGLTDKPVLLLFADDSELSQEKLSQIAEIYDYYLASELEIVSVITGKDPEEALEYQEELWLTYALFGDPQKEITKLYGIEEFPRVVILDNKHIVRYVGDYTTDEELRKELFKWMDEKVIVVTGRQFEYEPNIITVNKGDKVLIKLLAEDTTHGMFIDGYELYVKQYLDRDGIMVPPEKADHHIKPGELGLLRFIANKSGRFTMRCAATCAALHPYMVGYLMIKPNYRYYAALFFAFLLSVFSLFYFSKEKNANFILGIFPLKWRFELTRYPIVRKIVKSRWLMPFLPIVFNLFVFAIILFAGVVGGVSPGNYNFGIMFVWILWWVLLMMIMVPFFSRIWCGVCPLPMFGEWLQRLKLIGVSKKLYGLNKRWPKSLRNMWLVNFLFMGTTFTTAFITTRPIGTFILLGVVIILGNIVISLIYQKRTFCLYLCPVGGFQGLFSNLSTLEIRAKDREICKRHTPKECFVGSEKGYGCPWMELPFRMNRNTYCGLCFECFKSCSKDNMAINLRPPGVDLLVDERRGLDEAWKGFIMIGCAIAFYVIMQGPWGILRDWANAKTSLGYLKYIFSHSVFTLLLLPAFYGIFVYLSRCLSRTKEISYRKTFVNYSYCLVPLGLMAWIAFSFGILLPNGSYLIAVVSDPFAWGWNLFGTADFPWTPFLTGAMPYLQIFSFLFGLVLSIDIGVKLSQQMFLDKRQAMRSFVPIVGFLLLLTLSFIWLFTG